MTLAELIFDGVRGPTLGETVPVDAASAIAPFPSATRRRIVPPVLDSRESAAAQAWNGRTHSARSGVEPGEILAALASYVDTASVASAITAYNAANRQSRIAPGAGSIDAVFVESVHQFQKKVFRDTSQHDGMAGESTLDSLGLISRTGLHSWNRPNRVAQGRLNQAGAAVEAATSGEFSATNWFQNMANPGVLGETFNRGVHVVLLRKLRQGEGHLLTLPGYRNMTPVELGSALGITEKHKGSRPTAVSGSMHTFGLATDIAYASNPWVRRTSSRDAIRRAVLLVSGRRLSRARITQEFGALGSDATLSSSQVYDRVSSLNRALREYLSLESDPNRLQAAIAARTAARTDGIVQRGETPAAAVARWRGLIRADRAALSAGDFSGHNPPAQGFLGHHRDLVVALREFGCLAWGGSDIGGGAFGSGDMMHFDARADGAGRLLASVPGPNGRNFVPRTGHPCVTPQIGPPAEEAVVLAEQAIATTTVPSAYGGFDLQRGDRDDSSIWGGTRQTGSGTFVLALQRDLQALGFQIVGTPDGVLGRATEWAIREFQIYSKMATVAVENRAAPIYGDRLSATPNTNVYTGPASGVVNARTRALVAHWVRNRWRCPVVVEAWTMRNGRRHAIHSENLWAHDSLTSTVPRVFVKDLSGYYTLPVALRGVDRLVLGDFARYSNWHGPRSVPPSHTVRSAELLPEHLVGTPLARLTNAERSTFKVVRAVSEVECLGFFDSVNSYDNAFVSVGPAHWTLGIASRSGAVSRGELPAFLALLQHFDRAAYDRAFGFFGLRPERSWATGGQADGSAMFSRSQHKYTSWVALEDAVGGHTTVTRTESEGDYFKSWHWFYRFAMAGRTIGGYRRRMWHMARIRIRDILDTPFAAGVVPDVGTGGGSSRTAKIGDVFTSERATAMLLRWHIRSPASIVSGGMAGARVVEAVRRAAVPASAGDPTLWTDRHERALIRGLTAESVQHGNQGFQRSMTMVHNFPTWVPPAHNPRGYSLDPGIGQLSDTRNSLRFAGGGLPPAP